MKKLLVLLGFTLFVILSCANSESEVAGKIVYIMRGPEGRGGGTGVHVKAPSGETYILTNRHVCEISEDGKTIWVKVNEEDRLIPRRILEKSVNHGDLCAVEPLPGVAGLEISDEKMVQGETYSVVGHPLMDPLTKREGQYLQSIDIEIFDSWISSDEDRAACSGPDQAVKEVPISMFGGTVEACIRTLRSEQLTVPTYPGNSGSPVLNSQNKVVALIFAARGGDNAGFAVPLDLIHDFLAKY